MDIVNTFLGCASHFVGCKPRFGRRSGATLTKLGHRRPRSGACRPRKRLLHARHTEKEIAPCITVPSLHTHKFNPINAGYEFVFATSQVAIQIVRSGNSCMYVNHLFIIKYSNSTAIVKQMFSLLTSVIPWRICEHRICIIVVCSRKWLILYRNLKFTFISRYSHL